VALPLEKEPIRPVDPAINLEEIRLRADVLFRAAQSQDLQAVIAEKIAELPYYDVQAMDRVVAILMWGRSGSMLLASYLDGHGDVIMLPESRSQRLYEFFERYQSLSWGDRLLGYTAFDAEYPRFFEGAFAISPDKYYAAVHAILEFYAEWPPEFLESRRAFFLFVHIAYNLALGRRPASSRPLIVYAQHVRDNVLATHLVEDFPQAKFVHTVRDPISSCDGSFRHHLEFVDRHILLPYSTLFLLANKDRPHPGMESRTWAIRFEDLHRDTAGTIHDLSDWLGLPFQATLLDSTFNGIPWVVKRDGEAWSGRRLEQAQRRAGDVSRKDRALLFAVFYENFVDWDYPCPNMFGHPIVRCIVFVSLLLLPMKMEVVTARNVFRRRTLPLLSHGNIWSAISSLLGIGFCRLKIIGLLLPAFLRRWAFGATLLQIGHGRYSKGLSQIGCYID
jgi:hypothetical protein